MSEVKLIEDTHTYLVDETPCPSTVTKELEKAGLSIYWNNDNWYMERGKAIHRATHLIDTGELDWESADERIMGFLEAYQRFKKESGIDFAYREKSLYHPQYQYCGTPDAFYPLTDIKSGEDNELQLGAYAALLEANGFPKVREAFTLKLNEDGTYKFTPTKTDIRTLQHIWFAVLTVNRYKENNQ